LQGRKARRTEKGVRGKKPVFTGESTGVDGSGSLKKTTPKTWKGRKKKGGVKGGPISQGVKALAKRNEEKR